MADSEHAGDLSRILYVDLARRVYWVEERPEIFAEWFGGAGAGIRLLSEECPQGIDPLSPKNPVILAVGIMNGVFPLASKTVAMFKSPLTGNLGESHAGGRSSIAIRMAGYGAIVIRGRSESPVYLTIDEKGARFRDASALWGMNSASTVGRIIREVEPGAGVRTIMRIGKAGERLIPYSYVTTETYRHFGRLGLGAVFGSKNLKAVVVSGKKSFKFKDPKAYRELYEELFKTFCKSPLMCKYHELGTPMNVLPLNMTGSLPSRNLQSNRFSGAQELSGENMAEKYLGRRTACAHCPVSCIHIAALREPYENEPYFYKTKMISYDYEPIYALGAMLELKSPEGYLKLMDTVEELGLDAMSTGVVLAWATEAMERGIVKEGDAGGIALKWGDHEAYIKAVKRIVAMENEFFQALAKGVKYASSKYGGEDFALEFGGNEMPGYHTGPVAHLGYLTGARHSHLDGAGYSIDQKMYKEGLKYTPEFAARELFEEESWRQVLSSLVVCYFARGVYTPEVVSRCLRTLGLERSPDELKERGRSVLKQKYAFKYREGFSLRDLRIPKRIYETPTPLGAITEEMIRAGLGEFEKLVVG